MAEVTRLAELRSDSEGHCLSLHTLPRCWPIIPLHSVTSQPASEPALPVGQSLGDLSEPLQPEGRRQGVEGGTSALTGEAE